MKALAVNQIERRMGWRTQVEVGNILKGIKSERL